MAPRNRAYLRIDDRLVIDVDRLAREYATGTIETIRRLAGEGSGVSGRLRRLKRSTVMRYRRAGVTTDATSRLRVTGRLLRSLAAVITATGEAKRRVVVRVSNEMFPRVAGLSRRRNFLGLSREDFSRLGKSAVTHAPLRVRKGVVRRP